MDAALNNRMRDLRVGASMTQIDLAKAVGVSRQTISSLEAGRYQPSLELGMKIARQFGCIVEQVFWLNDT